MKSKTKFHFFLASAQKEKKMMKSQQDFEEYKKNEMLAVHTQRQTDIDNVKEENDRLRTTVSATLQQSMLHGFRTT